MVPVAWTRASASPCLTTDPEKASSPACLLTGSDSPVSDDWSTLISLPSVSCDFQDRGGTRGTVSGHGVSRLQTLVAPL